MLVFIRCSATLVGMVGGINSSSDSPLPVGVSILGVSTRELSDSIASRTIGDIVDCGFSARRVSVSLCLANLPVPCSMISGIHSAGMMLNSKGLLSLSLSDDGGEIGGGR